MFSRRMVARRSACSVQIGARTTRTAHSTARVVPTFNGNTVPAIAGSFPRQRVHVSRGGRCGFLLSGLVQAGVEVGGVPVPPIVRRRRLLVWVVVLGLLVEQVSE